MLQQLVKRVLNPHSNLYRFFSYVYNYKDVGYLPPKIQNIDSIMENISRRQSPVKFIQVGSNDGISGDPLFDSINKYDWEGVLIEPIPFLFEKLKKTYSGKKEKLHFLNVAICAEEIAYKTIYALDERFKGVLSDWHFQLATFNREILHRHGIADVEKYITSYDVPVLQLKDVIYKYVKGTVDFLHIDAEGYDYEIVKTIDFQKILPQVILVEYIHLDAPDRKGLQRLLKANNYVTYRCNQDYIALHRTIHHLYIKGTKKYAAWN